MPVIQSWEVKDVNVAGRTVKILASPETENMLVEKFTFGSSILPPKYKTVVHSHPHTEECIYVMSGRGKALIKDQTFPIEPDSVIVVGPDEKHEFHNDSDETMKLIWVYVPPGAEEQLLSKPTS